MRLLSVDAQRLYDTVFHSAWSCSIVILRISSFCLRDLGLDLASIHQVGEPLWQLLYIHHPLLVVTFVIRVLPVILRPSVAFCALP